MAEYRHILLAADFSEHGDYVAGRVKALTNRYQAKLSIIHVLDNIPMPDTGYGTVIPLDQDSSYDLLEADKTRLIDLGKKLQIETADLCLVWGVPKQEIVQQAERLAVDLIAVGSHGRHGLTMLLGSTANAVLHHAKCDVIAIRLPED